MKTSQHSSSRYENCHDWPEARVVSTDWRTNRQVEPETTAVCPSCGYRPVTVVVEEIEDWRGERNRRPG